MTLPLIRLTLPCAMFSVPVAVTRAAAELVVVAGPEGNVRVGATEEALQPGLARVAEMIEAENILHRLEHGIVVIRNVGHRSRFQEWRYQNGSGAIAAKALEAEDHVRKRRGRLREGADVGSSLLTAAGLAGCADDEVALAIGC